MYDMFWSYRYFICEFLFMCIFLYFIVYWSHVTVKFVYEFMIFMYLVLDHMNWICYDFEHSTSILSVTGRTINLCYIILFDWIDLYVFFSADNRIYLFVCSYIREMKIQMEMRIGIWTGCAYINQHRDIGVYEMCRNRRKKAKRWL